MAICEDNSDTWPSMFLLAEIIDRRGRVSIRNGTNAGRDACRPLKFYGVLAIDDEKPTVLHDVVGAFGGVLTDRGWELTDRAAAELMLELSPHLIEMRPQVELMLEFQQLAEQFLKDAQRHVPGDAVSWNYRQGFVKEFRAMRKRLKFLRKERNRLRYGAMT